MDEAGPAAGRGADPFRALDHLVLPVDDLAGAADAYATLGFTVGRRNRHPWGTENHIIQFPTAFLELIALAEDFAPLDPDEPAFPFAGPLAGQSGLLRPSGMVVLQSQDAAADAARFAETGIGAGRTLDFARSGRAADGTTRTVAFSLAFAQAPALPGLGFFVCRQHHPENFWDPAQQRHANGVTGLRAVVIEADQPADQATFLQHFCGAPAVSGPDHGLSLTLADGVRLIARRGAAPAGRLAEVSFAGPSPFRQEVGGLVLRSGP